VKAQLRAELLKHRSTRTGIGLLAGMLGLILLAVLVHAYGLSAKTLGSREHQLIIFGRGEFLATLFAAILGALSITSEIRHGTIRPTLLITPWRDRVVLAKVLSSMLIAGAFGLVGSCMAAGVGAVVMHARAIPLHLLGGDYLLLIFGGMVAAALWAAIGVGLGAIIRHQVPTTVGICAWLLFIEGLLVGDNASLTKVGRFFPGAAATAITGQNRGTLLAPALALIVLAAYAAASTVAGVLATARRDVT